MKGKIMKKLAGIMKNLEKCNQKYGSKTSAD
jgi:hypothetical protein